LKFKTHGSSNCQVIQQSAWTSDLPTAGTETLVPSALRPETNVRFIIILRSQIAVPYCYICVSFLLSSVSTFFKIFFWL